MIPFYIIAVILVALLYMYFEAGWVQVNDVYFTKSSKCLKILHLSDIHTNLLRVNSTKIKQAIKNANPDIIVLTGDYIEKPVDVSEFLDNLQHIKSGYRTLLCFGNHDHRAFNHFLYSFINFSLFYEQKSAFQAIQRMKRAINQFIRMDKLKQLINNKEKIL